MSIQQNEIMLYLLDFRNIDLSRQGLYKLRFQILNAFPYMRLEQLGVVKKQSNQSRSENIGNYFISNPFWVRYEDEYVQINDGCIFRLDVDNTKENIIIIELLHCDSRIAERVDVEDIEWKSISSFRIQLNNLNDLNKLLVPVDFSQNESSLLNLMIFSCPLNIKDAQVHDIERLRSVSTKLCDFYKTTIKSFVSNPLQFQYSLSQLLNQLPEDVEPQLRINNISLNMYQNWYNFIQLLPTISDKIYQQEIKLYYQELNMKYNDFIIHSQIRIENNNLLNLMRNTWNRNLYKMDIEPLNLLDSQPILKIQSLRQSFEQAKWENHLVIFVHGYKGSQFDMKRWKNAFRIRYPNIHTFIPISNQRIAGDNIDRMGFRLKEEVLAYIQCFGKFDKISFVCHSLGGIIVRNALIHLKSIKDNLLWYISLGTPHLGLPKNLGMVSAGLWVMTSLIQDISMVQLALKDCKNKRNGYMYNLSLSNGLQQFQRVILVGSQQDDYVPCAVSTVQPMVLDSIAKQKIYDEMLHNLQLPKNTSRIDVDFQLNQNWDRFVGRAAHMQLVENYTMINMIINSI